MTCCGTKIETNRNADCRRVYTPNEGFTFSTFNAEMQIRVSEGAAGPALLTVTMSATPNGSVFSIVGSSLVLTIDSEDLESLPAGDPISDPAYFFYDIIITDGSGFSSVLVSGPFILIEGVTR